MLEELYNPTVAKVYWWRSRAFRIGLAIFVGLAVLAVVLFNQQIGNLLKSFGTKAGTQKEIILNTNSGDSATYFLLNGGSTPTSDLFRVQDGKLMLNPPVL